MISKGPAHQNSTFGVGKWSPKLHSMFPQAGDPKVIVAGTSKHIFWNYSNLNPAWGISESTLLKLLQLNVRQHGPITQAHSTTCCRTSFSMQSVRSQGVPPRNIYTRVSPTYRASTMGVYVSPIRFASSPSSSSPTSAPPKSISFWNYLNLTWVMW